MLEKKLGLGVCGPGMLENKEALPGPRRPVRVPSWILVRGMAEARAVRCAVKHGHTKSLSSIKTTFKRIDFRCR